MTEAETIAISELRLTGPATVASLAADLRSLGVGDGDVVIVHTAMSRLGWVAGGPQALVLALLDAVGAGTGRGTIVMPAHSGLSDPARWSNPPVPAGWIPVIRAETPAFDPALTPTRAMGQTVDCFRSHPSTIRSNHPTVSFTANGPLASRIVDDHPLTPSLGEGSPLQRLYDLDAKVLLLGVDHGNNTSLHLAEHRAIWPGKHSYTEGVPVLVDGERRWVTYEDLELDEDDFPAIGEAFAATGLEQAGPIGAGVGRLSSVRAVVDFAVEWIEQHRN